MGTNLNIEVLVLGEELFCDHITNKNLNLVLHLINTWVQDSPFVFIHNTKQTEWIPTCIPLFSGVLATAGKCVLQLTMVGCLDMKDLEVTHVFFDEKASETYSSITVTDTQIRIISYLDAKPVSCTILSKYQS